MKMSMAQLGRVAKNMLKIVRERKLDGLGALDKVVDEPLAPDSDDEHYGEEYVIVHRRGGRRFSIDYFRRTGQTPIMFLADPEGIKCMLTAEKELEGYTVFDTTDFGLMQDRRLDGAEFGLIVKELESIIEAAAKGGKGEDPRAAELDAALERAGGLRSAPEAVALLTPALETARALGDANRLASCLSLLGQAERHSSKPEDAIKHLEEAVGIYKKSGDLAGQKVAFFNLHGIYRELKRYPEARACGQGQLMACHKAGDIQGVGRATFNLAYLYMLEGNAAEAETGFGHALKVMNSVGDQEGIKALQEARKKLTEGAAAPEPKPKAGAEKKGKPKKNG